MLANSLATENFYIRKEIISQSSEIVFFGNSYVAAVRHAPLLNVVRVAFVNKCLYCYEDAGIK